MNFIDLKNKQVFFLRYSFDLVLKLFIRLNLILINANELSYQMNPQPKETQQQNCKMKVK